MELLSSSLWSMMYLVIIRDERLLSDSVYGLLLFVVNEANPILF